MNETYPLIFGIGNPLVDVVIQASESDLINLELNKGTMDLVDEDRQKEIISYFNGQNPIYFPGGSAPNTMLACAGLGINSHIAGRIGDDKLGDIYIDRVNEYGADSGLVRGGGRTGSSIILVTPDGERTMNTNLGACQGYSSLDIDKEKLARAKFFYFTGYMWDTESQKKAIQKAVKIAKSSNLKICFDVADPFAVERNRESFLEFINNNVDIVFANQPELSILFKSTKIDHTINKLMNIVKCGAVKLGKEGSIVFNNSKKSQIEPNLIPAKDTTGAGDMYAAGFLSSFFKTNDYKASGIVGSALAEEVIQINGAQLSKNKVEEIRSKFF